MLLVLVYAAQPREGTETLINLGQHGSTRHNVVYAAQPREGTETILGMIIISYMHDTLVYAAQPREGTETLSLAFLEATLDFVRFMQLNPARGRKRQVIVRGSCPHCFSGLCSSTPRGDGNLTQKVAPTQSSQSRFMQLNPARGRKLGLIFWVIPRYAGVGLCSSTPRGDGNSTSAHATGRSILSERFMQLNPARGRKLSVSSTI